jgi:hypothetical protein
MKRLSISLDPAMYGCLQGTCHFLAMVVRDAK